MRKIELTSTGINMNISVFLFKEDNIFHAYCPELDLLGCDDTEDGARQSFDCVLKEYIDYTVSHGTLEKDLIAHGWRKMKNGHVSGPTPATLLRRTILKEVMNKSEFSKYSIPVTL